MENKNDWSWPMRHELEEYEIKDVLTTAIEGGIGYWACLGNDDPAWIKAKEELLKENEEAPCYCDIAFKVLEDGNAIILYDEENDEKLTLTKEKLIKGFELFENKYNMDIRHYLENGYFDADCADMVIQLAVFGEVIYG